MSTLFLIRNFLACLLIFGAVFFGSPGHAEGLLNQPWKVEADKLSRGDKENEVVAEGNVVLQRTGNPDRPMTIEADWIRYDAEAGMVHARGHVKMLSKMERAEARQATISLGDETAQMVDSTIFFPQTNIHFASAEARKEGEMVYFFRDGVFTTCDYDDEHSPVWSLTMKEADIDVDGFIFMKHSVLRIKDVPVLYLPFMAFPGRMSRQTGFLDPEISSSDRGGSGLMTPFFVDLSPSADITLYPAYYAERGPMIGGEFRFIHDYDSRFGIQATFLDDQLQDEIDDDYLDDGYLRTRSNRYWLRSKGDYDLGDDFKVLLDVDFASDPDFLMEFNNGMIGSEASHADFLNDFDRGLAEPSLPWRPSSLQLVKHWSHLYLGAETTYVDDLRPGSTPESTVVQTLPKVVNAGSLALSATRVNLNWDAEYVHYWRKEGVGMQRLDLHPRLTTPLALGPWLEAQATGGLRQTSYQMESSDKALYSGDTTPGRLAWDGAVDLSTTLQRDFKVRVGSWRWLNHTLKPHASYAYLDTDQEEEVMPDFDSKDTLVAQSVVGYGLENHFLIGGVSGDEEEQAYSRYFGSFKVNHSYDHRKDFQPYGNLLFDLDIYPLRQLRVNYSTALSVYGRGFVSYDLLTRYTNQRGDFLAADYRYNKDSDIHEINASGQVRLTEAISLRADIKQSLAVNNVVSQSLSVIYQPGCWGMQVELSESGGDRQLTVMFSLVAVGQAFGLGYEDNFSADTSFTTSTRPLEHDNF